MGRQTTVTLPNTNTYDDCLIATCLKSLFKKADKAEPTFTISRYIADVKKELEQVNKADILEMSYPYLAAMEASIPGAGFRYAVIYEQNVPVLFGYFQLFTLSSKNFNLEKNKGFVKGIFRFFLKLKKVSVLISGNALRNDTVGYCFNETIVSHEGAIELMASVAEKIADEECVTAIILKDVPQSKQIRKWLTGLGYKMPWQDNVMTLDIEARWTSLTQYIDALSRKYKTRANKILASGSDISVKELKEEGILQHNKEINRLFKNVADNQSFVLTQLGDDHFSGLKKVYKDNFEVLGFFHKNKLVAFYSAFVTGDAYELYYVGFDYEMNGEYQLYFNMLFSGLERAIVLKKKQLKLGRTSFDAKASLGAKPVEINYFIKTASLPAAVSSWFADYFSTMEDAKWKLRNPLK